MKTQTNSQKKCESWINTFILNECTTDYHLMSKIFDV